MLASLLLHRLLTLHMADFWQVYAPSCSASQGCTETKSDYAAHLHALVSHLVLFTGHKEAQQLCGLQQEQAQH